VEDDVSIFAPEGGDPPLELRRGLAPAGALRRARPGVGLLVEGVEVDVGANLRAAPLTSQPHQRLVRDDPVQPGRDPRAAGKAVAVTEHLLEGVLDRVPGGFGVAGDAQGDGAQTWLEPREERPEALWIVQRELVLRRHGCRGRRRRERLLRFVAVASVEGSCAGVEARSFHTGDELRCGRDSGYV
jgi:hypothetical protein